MYYAITTLMDGSRTMFRFEHEIDRDDYVSRNSHDSKFCDPPEGGGDFERLRDGIYHWYLPWDYEEPEEEGLPALLTEHRWQPISTAPKDGTHFIATGHEYGKTDGPRFQAVVWWHEERGEFVEGADDGPDAAHTIQYLTHWQPCLPDPEDNL